MEQKARDWYAMQISSRDKEIEVLKKEKHLLHKQLGSAKSQVMHWKALSEQIRAEFEAPGLFPETRAIREIFPRFPFIHISQQRILLTLWDHLTAFGPESYVSARQIHHELYADRPSKARPKLQTIHVFVCYLRRSLKGSRLTVEGKHMEGWRLKISEESSELSSPESENKIDPS